jgi:amidase
LSAVAIVLDKKISYTSKKRPSPGTIVNDSDHPMSPMRRAGQFVPFTPPFNTSSQPAISLPLRWTAQGLPIGMQVVAGYGREDVLIRIASRLEQANPWADRTPDI